GFSAPQRTARRTCSRRCWGPRCARATPSAARRRLRASRAWRRRSATSSTCCWCEISVDLRATRDSPSQAPMPRITRRRRVGAPPAAVWELVSNPYNLPRWWPRAQRVEAVEGEGEGAQWTLVLGTGEGRGVRADFLCTAAVTEERFAWEQQIPGTPFERHLR